jgi:hypothetical protein
MLSLRNFFFFAKLFFSNEFFISSEKQIKFATRSTTAAVQSKSNSHVNVFYQPVEFTSFCLEVNMLFLRRQKELP